MSNDKVVFLAFRREENETDVTEHMSCRACRNKTWTVTWQSSDDRACIKCAACGTWAGRIGWYEEEAGA